MTVADLIAELEFMNPEAEVRFASQPSWPYEYSINSVQEVQIDDEEADEPDTVIFLEEGRQLGYLPAEAIFQLGW